MQPLGVMQTASHSCILTVGYEFPSRMSTVEGLGAHTAWTTRSTKLSLINLSVPHHAIDADLAIISHVAPALPWVG